MQNNDWKHSANICLSVPLQKMWSITTSLLTSWVKPQKDPWPLLFLNPYQPLLSPSSHLSIPLADRLVRLWPSKPPISARNGSLDCPQLLIYHLQTDEGAHTNIKMTNMDLQYMLTHTHYSHTHSRAHAENDEPIKMWVRAILIPVRWYTAGGSVIDSILRLG